MQPPRDTPPKKPSTLDWKQRRGTSISLGSIGQSALRPAGGARPSLLSPKPVQAKPAQAAAPKPAPKPATPPAPKPASHPGPDDGQMSNSAPKSPQVSRAFMSGSLVPPRPLGQRPVAAPMPEFPRRDAPAARAAEPQPLPKPAPAAAETAAQPGPRRATGIAPVAPPKPEPEVLAAEAAAAAPAAAQPAPSPAPAAAAPRRPAKNVRQFNAAMAAEARAADGTAKAPGRFAGKRLLVAGVSVLGVTVVAATAFFLMRQPATAPNGMAGVAANEVSLAPQQATPAPAAAAATEIVADNSSTSAVTEAPSDAPAVITERPASPQANLGALVLRGAHPAQPTAAVTRAGGVVLAPLPDAPDLGRAAAATAAAEPAPAPPPAAPIRLPNADEAFSTNTPNPEPGG